MFPQCWWLLCDWWPWQWELAGFQREAAQQNHRIHPGYLWWLFPGLLTTRAQLRDPGQVRHLSPPPPHPELVLPTVAPVPSSFLLEFCLVISILGILAKSNPTLQWSIAHLLGPWRLHVKMVNELQSCLSSLSRPGPWRLQVRMVNKPQSSLARPPQGCSFSGSG